jgi:hypothetical protein
MQERLVGTNVVSAKDGMPGRSLMMTTRHILGGCFSRNVLNVKDRRRLLSVSYEPWGKC